MTVAAQIPVPTSTVKSVTIEIASGDIETLKAGRYSLCFARNVGGRYNVIWQAYSDFLAKNWFGWTAQYQLFGTSAGYPAGSETNAVDIAPGQQAILDRAGVLGSAVTGGPADKISLINNYGPIHPGLSCVSTGPDGVKRMLPIFLAPQPMVIGTERLNPVDKVQVWFQQDGTPGPMIDQAISTTVEIDLTKADAATRRYQDGIWIVPTA
jgi:hypothetical protein